MKLTKYEHAAYLIEDGADKLLLDPGVYSTGFEDVTGITMVLFTHVHADHYDEDKLAAVLNRNPEATILADEDTAAKVIEAGHTAIIAKEGETHSAGAFAIEVIGHDHAVIYRTLPTAKNVGYMINGRVFYPGDAFTVPAKPVEVLLLPISGPWLKIAEVVDYAVAVHPKLALPTHEAASSMPKNQYGMIGELTKQEGVDFRPLEVGESIEV